MEIILGIAFLIAVVAIVFTNVDFSYETNDTSKDYLSEVNDLKAEIDDILFDISVTQSEAEIDEAELTYLKAKIEVRQEIITELLKKLK
jgi:peptidoglycan hydrolase CwlO-like protein